MSEESLERKRIEWLYRVCCEARGKYGFSYLAELVEFILDNAHKIQVKSGD